MGGKVSTGNMAAASRVVQVNILDEQFVLLCRGENISLIQVPKMYFRQRGISASPHDLEAFYTHNCRV